MTIDLFLEACGARGPLYFEVEGLGPEGVERRIYSQPFALIGRDARADLSLDHERVSRRHAYLQMIDGQVFCVDLGSRAGVRWDADRRARSGWLGEGQTVHIGPFALRLPPSEPDGDADTGRLIVPPDPFRVHVSGRVRLPDILLEFRDREGAAPLVRWQMTRRLALVGRAPDCQVRLQDKSLSRFHCSLLRTPKGLWAVDLLGRDGIAVNGESVRVARLEDGDELKIGRVTIDVRYDASTGSHEHDDLSPPETRTVMIPASEPSPPSRLEGARARRGVPARQESHRADAPGAGHLVSGPESWLPTAGGGRDADENDEASLPLLANQMLLMNQSMMESFGRTVMMMFQEIRDLHGDEMRLLREELDRVHRLSEELALLQAKRALTPPADGPPRDVSSGVERKFDARRPTPPVSSPPPARTPDAPVPRVAPKIPDRTAGRPEDAQDWLCQRIEAIKDEQQSRWSKVLKLIQKKK